MPADKPIALEFLLVSADSSTLKTVKSAVSELGSNLNCSTTAQAAGLYLTSHRLDGAILDLDVRAAGDLIAAIRRGGSSRRAFIFVCVKPGEDTAAVLKLGANAVLLKPLAPETIAANIRSFQPTMAAERRRYFRHQVTIPVSLTVQGVEHSAMIDNLSQGGMAALLAKPFDLSLPVGFSFELPFGPRIYGNAQAAWANDQQGLMGFEFRTLHGESGEQLADWLTQRSLNV